MPPRPVPLLKQKHTANRLSAVYIGSNPGAANHTQQPSSSPSYFTSPPNPDTSHIPDLPEPPSPGASSNGSGLPSPPATNSTGSGSTGDPQTVAIRERPLSFTSSSGSSTGGSLANNTNTSTGGMLKGPTGGTLHRSSSSISSASTSSHRQGRFDDGPYRRDIDNNISYEHSHNGSIEDEEGDNTARLDLRALSANENVRALERAKSLTQRNRMVRCCLALLFRD